MSATNTFLLSLFATTILGGAYLANRIFKKNAMKAKQPMLPYDILLEASARKQFETELKARVVHLLDIQHHKPYLRINGRLSYCIPVIHLTEYSSCYLDGQYRIMQFLPLSSTDSDCALRRELCAKGGDHDAYPEWNRIVEYAKSRGHDLTIDRNRIMAVPIVE